jgi:hypothetical protein
MPHNTAAHRGKTPTRKTASHEDTSSDTRAQVEACTRRVRLGHITNSLFTLQSAPPPPRANHAPSGSPLLLQTSDEPPAHRAVAFGVVGATPVAWLQRCCDRGGGERDRTDDLLLAKQALSQLSYTPGQKADRQKSEAQNFCHSDFCSAVIWMVGQGGFEPPTSRLSSARSNQLSY